MKEITYPVINGKRVKTTIITVDNMGQQEQAVITTGMVQGYEACCKKFAADTRRWGNYDEYNFYSTDGSGDWYESCDNDKGGLDVKWAFHMTTREIERGIRKYLEDLIEDMLFNLDPGCSKIVQEELNKLT